MINFARKGFFALMEVILLTCVISTEVLALSYPPTLEKVVVDVYHDMEVSDPYRWMESKNNPEYERWLKAQGEFTQRTLETIPGRERLEKRVLELARESMSIRNPEMIGSRLFFLQRKPGESTYKLAVMQQEGGIRKILVDPDDFADKNSHASIDWFKVSPDGNLIALGISKGGSEHGLLRVFDVEKMGFLNDSIDRALNASWTVRWLEDNKHFFYKRTPVGERYKKSRIHLHKLGRNPDQDPAVWGYEVNPNIPISANEESYFRVQPGSTHVVAVVVPGTGRDRRFYSTTLMDLVAGKAKWHKLADGNKRWFRGYLHTNHLYVISQKAATRLKLLKVDLRHPQREPELLIPSGNAVLEHAAVARDAIYIQAMDVGIDKLIRIPHGSAKPEWIDLPFDGRIRDIEADITQDGVLFRMEGWTQSPKIFRLSPDELKDTKIIADSTVNFGDIVVTRDTATSHDGIQVPITIIHRKGIKLDGHNSTILVGYGAYGFSSKPKYDAKLMAWFERDGVYAIAHVRGGGEYGQEWHKDGKILTKSNTILDFVACAEYLIEHAYTEPGKLAGAGRSAGGITIGGAITERPELFAAANHGVGLADLLRAEQTSVGSLNIPEFGTVKKKYQFLAMHSISPYHRVKDNVQYPAVILTTGTNDPRVASWHPGKLAARLQKTGSPNRPVLLRVDHDAGHGIGSTLEQEAKARADVWAFFLWQMDEPDFQ